MHVLTHTPHDIHSLRDNMVYLKISRNLEAESI